MKSTGIIRLLDELGRIVIPKELREKFKLKEKDPIEIFVEGSNIILRKYETSCIFCNHTKKLVSYNGELICSKCAEKISNIVNTNK